MQKNTRVARFPVFVAPISASRPPYSFLLTKSSQQSGWTGVKKNFVVTNHFFVHCFDAKYILVKYIFFDEHENKFKTGNDNKLSGKRRFLMGNEHFKDPNYVLRKVPKMATKTNSGISRKGQNIGVALKLIEITQKLSKIKLPKYCLVGENRNCPTIEIA